MIKNGVCFIVIAFLFAKVLKILVYANFAGLMSCKNYTF